MTKDESPHDEPSKSKKKLFYTTSDMVKTMNNTMASLDSPGDAISPRVELQRRMPNGSTRRVTEKDMEAADMDSKLKQAAEQVADLNPKEKIEWAQRQRQEGNILYKEGDYREALDVYLTCLVAKTDDPDFTTQVFLPVMNNLAQSSLQMGMYRKAHQFCTMALEDVPVAEHRTQLVAKLFFRRGRALRLSGEYDAARGDLNTALSMLEKDSTEFRSVQREFQLIQRAEIEERRNEKRQELAMQQLLRGKPDESAPSDDSISGKKSEIFESMVKRELSLGLYQGVESKRMFSTLTARKRDDDAEQVDPKQSYWLWYLSMIAHAAEKLLVLLGDEEYSNRHSDDGITDLSRRKSD